MMLPCGLAARDVRADFGRDFLDEVKHSGYGDAGDVGYLADDRRAEDISGRIVVFERTVGNARSHASPLDCHQFGGVCLIFPLVPQPDE